MKITDIRIGRFGVWHDLELALRSSGLSVFYGPNEAGKTTLMRFVRGALYGFESHVGQAFQPDSNNQRSPAHRVRLESLTYAPEWAGSLRVEHDGSLGEIRRTTQPGGRGTVEVSGWGEALPADEQLATLLGGIGQTLFQNVFAVGLHELQELATLHDDAVIRHIYGLTLGPEGQRLLGVLDEIAQQRRRLIDGRDGELARLVRQDAACAAEIEPLAALRRRHAELCGQRVAADQRIADLKRQQTATHGQLRGHLFLERIWGPWSQAQQCRDELEQMPPLHGFPQRGLERLDELDAEIAARADQRDHLLGESRRLYAEAEALRGDAEVRKHAATMQGFVDRREWLAEVSDNIAAAETRAAQAQAEFDGRLAAFGPPWSAARIERVDTSTAAHYRMTGAAQNYRAAVVRRARFQRRALRTSEVCHQRLVQIEERLKHFGGLPVDAAIETTRERLARLEETARLRTREAQLSERLRGLGGELDRLESRLALPKWVAVIFAFFVAAGGLAMLVGLATGVRTNGIAGAMWALLGLTCGGLAWALKSHFQSAVRESIDRLQDEERRDEAQLVRIRGEMAVLDRREAASPLARIDAALTDDAARIRHTAQQVSELERLAEYRAQVLARRRRLSETRRRLPAIQREVSTARQQWCELLTQLGLDETLRVDDAFEMWQQVAEAAERRRQWDAAQSELHDLRQTWQGVRKRIEALGHRIGRGQADYRRPLDVLAAWDEELKQSARYRAERRRLRREAKGQRKQAAELRPQIAELQTQRGALLVQGGAADRAQFEQRAAAAARRQELVELLALAESELDVARRTQPDLAIVEEDLERYDPDENGRRVARLNREIDEQELSVLAACEELGRRKQEIQTLEDDRRVDRLHGARAEHEQRMIELAEQWCGLEHAAAAVDQMRTHYERTSQPAVLAAASQYLEQLTRGRYRTLWTPLGQRQLCVEDGRGRTLRVEQLSNGTREQLFLSVRLALVREFAQVGIELPMVLDDILVNFDQVRTEAAIDTLMQFAEEGQQILLFTCHLHLAHLCESRGIEPTWLPGHHAPLEERLAG